jgi:hypothetical protein
VAQRYARKRGLQAVEWLVYATACTAEPQAAPRPRASRIRRAGCARQGRVLPPGGRGRAGVSRLATSRSAAARRPGRG